MSSHQPQIISKILFCEFVPSYFLIKSDKLSEMSKHDVIMT